jgi:hypothetical protein
VLGRATYVGLIPVFLGLMAAASVGALPNAERTVRRPAQIFLALVRFTSPSWAPSSRPSYYRLCTRRCSARVQIAHTIRGRLMPEPTDRGKLWSVRLIVMMLSTVAYLLSVTSQRIHDLVETASAFGSAGVFVTPRCLRLALGRDASTYASLAAGMLVWAAGT